MVLIFSPVKAFKSSASASCYIIRVLKKHEELIKYRKTWEISTTFVLILRSDSIPIWLSLAQQIQSIFDFLEWRGKLDKNTSWVAKLAAVPLVKYILVRQIDFFFFLFFWFFNYRFSVPILFFLLLNFVSATHVDTGEIVAVKIVSLHNFPKYIRTHTHTYAHI